MKEIVDLIGMHRTNPAVMAFIDDIKGTAEADSFGGLLIYDYKNHGLSVYFDENTEELTNLFFYPEGKDGHNEYKRKLPHGLSFSDPRELVRSRLGTPNQSKENWDRFDFETHFIHITYLASGKIDLIRAQTHRSQPNNTLQTTSASLRV